jgi:membrane-associated protein
MDLSFITNPEAIIGTLGVLGVVVIIFLETGAFFGFFFPGDTLLFTAGFLASKGYVSLTWLLIGAFVAAVIGDNVGYYFGKKIGPALFNKEESVFFNKKHVLKAQHFYEKHGRKTIILARFLPIVRTFAPILAGVGKMEYKIFFLFNVIGGFIWTWAMLWLGFGLGSLIPDPDKYVLPIIAIIILASAIAPLREILKAHAKGARG